MIFVTSGCSFTEGTHTWPQKVYEHYKSVFTDFHNVAEGSIGNGMIANRLLYKLENLLKTESASNIIVGVMWSGVDRFEVYHPTFYDSSDLLKYNSDGWVKNPLSVNNQLHADYKWIILNHHWKLDLAYNWYSTFHSNIGAWVHTLKSILLVQNYLKLHNIKYFMTTYMDIFNECEKNDIDINYLYQQIDFSSFLPVKGCFEWVKENFKGKKGMQSYYVPEDKHHPSVHGYSMFAHKIVIPYINDTFN